MDRFKRRLLALALAAALLCAIPVPPVLAAETKPLATTLVFTDMSGAALSGPLTRGTVLRASWQTEEACTFDGVQAAISLRMAELTFVPPPGDTAGMTAERVYTASQVETAGGGSIVFADSVTAATEDGAAVLRAAYTYADDKNAALTWAADKALLMFYLEVTAERLELARLPDCVSFEAVGRGRTVYGVPDCKTKLQDYGGGVDYALGITVCPSLTAAQTGSLYDTFALDQVKAGLTVQRRAADGAGSTVADYTLYTDAACTSPLEDGGLTAGSRTVYVRTAGGLTAPVSLTVLADTLVSIAISEPPARRAYTAFDAFDPAGMTVSAVYASGRTETVTEYTLAPDAPLTVADTAVTVRYGGKTAAQPITVAKRSVAKPVAASEAPVYNGASRSIAYAVQPDPDYVTVTGEDTGVNAGGYTAAASLRDTVNTQWEDGTSGAVTLAWSIAKAEPAASDFAFTAPGDLGYDGQAKTAGVTAKPDVRGVGAVTVRYQPEPPVAVGTYTVSIDVAEGENYRAATGLTAEDWSFSIGKTANSVTVSMAGWTYGDSPESPVATADFGTVTLQYKPKAAGDEAYTGQVPTDAGTYLVRATVPATADYAAGSATAEFTIAPREAVLVWRGTGTRTYDGTASQVTASVENPVNGDNVTVAVTGGTEKNAGVHTATATGLSSGNYVLPTGASTVYEIEKAVLTPAITGVTGKVYDGTDGAPGASIVLAGAVNGEDPTATGNIRWTAAGAGTGTVRASNITLAPEYQTNYRLSAASIDGQSAGASIAKAARQLTAEPGALTLTPAGLQGTVRLTFQDLDGSGRASCALEGSAVSMAASGGSYTFTARKNGAATAVWTMDPTDNYEAATVRCTITAVAQAVTAVTVSGGPADSVSADLDGSVIRLSGVKAVDSQLTVTPALDPALDGWTWERQGDQILVKDSGGRTAATYAIDDSAVAENDLDVTVDLEAKVAPTLEESADQTIRETYGNANSIRAENVKEAAARELLTAAEAQLEQAADPEAASVELKATVTVHITPKRFDTTESERALTIDVTPTYTIEAVIADESGAAVQTKTLVADQPLTQVSGKIRIIVALPADFAPNVAVHTHDGVTEYLPVTVENGTASWEMGSFSEVRLLADRRTAAIVFTYQDGHGETVTYEVTDIGTALPTDATGTGTFRGWSIAGVSGTQTRLTQAIFDRLSQAGTATAASVVEQPPPTPTPTPAPGPAGPAGDTPPAEPAVYPVQVETPDHGTVTASPDSAKAGETVTLTAAPEEGYALEALTVSDEAGTALELTETGEGFTFQMPAGPVTVAARFQRAETPRRFIDVPEDAWFFDAVYWAVDAAVTDGTSENTFSPEDVCTRKEAVTFLWKQAGRPRPETGENPFQDVPDGAWYEDAVLWAVERGITKGTSADTFSPDLTVDRKQMLTLIYRAMEQPPAQGENPFQDVPDGAWYEDAVLWAVERGITKGTSAATFSPDDDCRRNQIVTFLYRCYGES